MHLTDVVNHEVHCDIDKIIQVQSSKYAKHATHQLV